MIVWMGKLLTEFFVDCRILGVKLKGNSQVKSKKKIKEKNGTTFTAKSEYEYYNLADS